MGLLTIKIKADDFVTTRNEPPTKKWKANLKFKDTNMLYGYHILGTHIDATGVPTGWTALRIMARAMC